MLWKKSIGRALGKPGAPQAQPETVRSYDRWNWPGWSDLVLWGKSVCSMLQLAGVGNAPAQRVGLCWCRCCRWVSRGGRCSEDRRLVGAFDVSGYGHGRLLYVRSIIQGAVWLNVVGQPSLEESPAGAASRLWRSCVVREELLYAVRDHVECSGRKPWTSSMQQWKLGHFRARQQPATSIPELWKVRLDDTFLTNPRKNANWYPTNWKSQECHYPACMCKQRAP